MSLLEVRNLVTGYGRIPVLHGVSLDVHQGELVALVGPNGAGKSTTMNALFGLLPVFEGEIRFDGRSIRGMDPSRAIRLGMGYVPQRNNVFAGLTVEENLDLSCAFARVGPGQKQVVYERFPALRGRARQRAGTLSGGERQMLALGCAILAKPRFLALDEPTTGLAPRIVQELIESINAIRHEGCTILWVVEENPRKILQHADRVCLLESGVIRRESTGVDLLADPQFHTLFLGR